MVKARSAASSAPLRGRLWVGGTILVLGFCAPALVPLVAASGLPIAWKTGLSGVLLFGLPELVMLIAVAILGRPGFDYLKARLWRLISPPEVVSPGRYRLGLVLFCIPLFLAWLDPYAREVFPALSAHRLWFAIGGDFMLVTSLFLLGGEFWGKLRALFSHRARVVRAED